MKLTRRGRCFQEYFSSEVTVTAGWGAGGRTESRPIQLTEPRRDPERGKESQIQREKGDRALPSVMTDSTPGKMPPCLRRQTWKRLGQRTPVMCLLAACSSPATPGRESAVGNPEPSPTLLCGLLVCRWTWPQGAVLGPSPSPGPQPAPAPALPLAAAH